MRKLDVVLDEVLDQAITTKLSLAVLLMDDFTKKPAAGNFEVSIPDLQVKAIRNPSGYYNFLDLPQGDHKIEVSNKRYLDESRDVEVPYYALGEPLRFGHGPSTALLKLEEETVPCARLKVPASAETDSIELKDVVAGTIDVGNVLMIDNRDSSSLEYCIVKAVPAGGGDGKYDLEYKLRRSHAPEASVKKMILDPDPPVVKISGAAAAEGDIKLSLAITRGEVKTRNVFFIDGAKKEICLIAEPVLKMTLKPNCVYLFPSGTTMIKGVVTGADGKPLHNIIAELLGENFSTRTGKKGDFVIYFPPSKEDGIVDIKIKSTGGVAEVDVKADVRKGKTVSNEVEYP